MLNRTLIDEMKTEAALAVSTPYAHRASWFVRGDAPALAGRYAS